MPTVDWGQKMEEVWGRAFVHESGHALMAVLQEIPCHGVCYERTESGGRFCTLGPPNPPGERKRKDYLFLAAGCAAENLIYKNHDEQAAGADSRSFDSPDSPPFDKIASEALQTLFPKRRQLKRLVSLLKAKVRQVDFNLNRLPEKGMDGSDKRYLILLSKEELEAAVCHS